MATILRQGAIGDGYDVRFETAGEAHTLHFTEQPSESDIAEAILMFEQRMIDAVAAALSLDEETGDVFLWDD
jgi:hypothetical protein